MSDAPDRDADLLSADEVTERLAEEPALRQVAALCVLPIVWVEGCGIRFRRTDLDVWIALEQARTRRLTQALERGDNGR